MKKRVAIIGAGVSGLCAGSYLQMNGYETEIFELHNLPGGLCTAWDRKGYRFDGCIHWLMGATSSSKMYDAWNELIDMKNLQIHFADDYFVLENIDGKQLTIYRDADKLEKELLEKAPEDRLAILELTSAIRKLSHLDFYTDKAPETMTLFDGLKMMWSVLPYIGVYNKWKNFSIEQYSKKFKNPVLRKAICEGFVPEMASIFFVYALASMHNETSGYPIGGSLNFAKQLEKRYIDLGGKIHYHSKVIKINSEKHGQYSIATGIELENGAQFEADYVISAADGFDTVNRMLAGKFVDETVKSYYEKLKVFSSYIQVSLGVNRTFENEPTLLSLIAAKPLEIDPGTTTDVIGARIFNFDPTLAPKGKTCIVITLPTYNHKYWTDLRLNDHKEYHAQKQHIANLIIDQLDRKYPGLKTQVEVVDVSTPATVIRYTNNWKGSFEGWILTPEMGLKQMKNKLPGLDHFYMIGQWTMPGGGLPACLISGRNVTQILCKKDKKKFGTQHF